MKLTTKSIGNRGEDLACDFLRSSGYKILGRNFRSKYGEIDVITKKNGELIFVEVKTRSSLRWGYPQEAVTPRKLKRIQRTIDYYLLLKKNAGARFKLEVLCLLKNQKGLYNYNIIQVD